MHVVKNRQDSIMKVAQCEALKMSHQTSVFKYFLIIISVLNRKVLSLLNSACVIDFPNLSFSSAFTDHLLLEKKHAVLCH